MTENNDFLSNGSWMSDPSLAHIEHAKLEFLQIMVFESRNLKQEEMLPFFMSVMKLSKEKKITFTEEEMNAILEVLKKHSSNAEINKINQIMSMRKSVT